MEKEIIKLYVENGFGSHKIGKLLHIGHKKVREILIKNGVPLKKKGRQSKNEILVGVDLSVYQNKWLECKKTGKIIKDTHNKSGSVLKHLIDNKIYLPKDSKYILDKKSAKLGKYWYEEFFNIIPSKKNSYVICPICGWKTVDVGNKTGSFTKHITTKHMTITEFVEEFPKHKKFFKLNDIDLTNEKTFIRCGVCGDPFKSITQTHLDKHNFTLEKYKKLYGEIFSESFKEDCLRYLHKGRENITKNFISKGQKELSNYIKSLGFKVLDNHKKSLKGVEIDIFIPELKIGFEYNGLFWHSEKMGKHKTYHLDKQMLAKKNGINLYHIFSDEWEIKQDIVKSRVKNILGKRDSKIYARNCTIKEIDSVTSNKFLNNHHIQGGDKSFIKLGAFNNKVLVGVMTFSKLRISLGQKNMDGCLELSRFASINVVGLGSKMVKFLIKNHFVKKIISYADRRWTPTIDNVYQKLGFVLDSETKPNYWYSCDGNKRESRFKYRKDVLIKRGYDKSKTEKDIMVELGYLKIWDCGSFKYVYDHII